MYFLHWLDFESVLLRASRLEGRMFQPFGKTICTDTLCSAVRTPLLQFNLHLDFQHQPNLEFLDLDLSTYLILLFDSLSSLDEFIGSMGSRLSTYLAVILRLLRTH